MQHLAFIGLRLFNLDDELGALEYRCGTGCNGRPHRFVMCIGNANAAAGAALDDHFMTAMRKLAYALGNESDPIVLNLDLFGYTDSHCQTFSLQMCLGGCG